MADVRKFHASRPKGQATLGHLRLTRLGLNVKSLQLRLERTPELDDVESSTASDVNRYSP